MSGAISQRALGLTASALSAIGLAAAASYAESSQTDWSGGGGVEGPVGAWQASFHVASDVSWLAADAPLWLQAVQRSTCSVSNLLAEPFD